VASLGELARASGLLHAPTGRVGSALAALAVREGCDALLGARIVAGRLEATPDARPTLIAAYRTAIAHDLLFGRALEELGAALRRAEIPALLLKGAALRRLVFAAGERSMSDVDVLVPARRWSDAIAAVGAPIGVAGRPVTSRHDYAALVAVGGMPVEIHRHLCAQPLFSVDERALFLRADEGADGLAVPAPSDLFISLAIHAAKHGFALPFRAVLDALALAPLANADAVVDRALAFRAENACAAWLAILVRAGLGGPWIEAASRLGATGPRARLVARTAPFGGHDRPWRRVARIAGSVTPFRAALWLGQRSLFRLLDALATHV